MLRAGIGALVLMLTVALSPAAQAMTDTVSSSPDTIGVHELPSMLVTASRNQLLFDAPQSVAVIESEYWEGSGKSLADIIQEQSGVQTRKCGGTGSFQTVSLRGIPGSKILVFLDDIPLNFSDGSPVDLGKINPEQLKSVEIYKGITPAQFGGNNIGGVINLRSRGAREQRSLRLSSMVGSYATHRHSVSLHQPIGAKLGIRSVLSYESSDNDYPIPDRNNTPDNPDDDRTVVKQNEQYLAVSGIHNLSWSLDTIRTIGLYARHHLNRGGIPGSEGHVTHTAGFENSEVEVRLSYRRHEAPPWLTPSLSIAGNRTTSRYFWSAYDDMDVKGFAFIDLGTVSTKVFGKGTLELEAARWAKVHAQLTATSEDLLPQEYSDGVENTNWHNRRISVVTSVDASLMPFEQGLATVGYHNQVIHDETNGGFPSYDAEEIPSSDTTTMLHAGRLGLKCDLFHERVSLFANGGRYYRYPSLTERYGGKRGLLPNHELLPEEGYNIDAGLKAQGRRWYAEVLFFWNRTEKAVYYHQTGPLSKPLNLDATLTAGLEVNVNADLWKAGGIEVHGTMQNPQNISDALIYEDKYVPNEPVWACVVVLTAGPFHGFSASYTLDCRSGLYRDPANFVWIEPAVGHSAGVKWCYRESVTLHLAGENLGDYFDEHANYSYPYPGRRFFCTLTVTV